jgi:hypothetical protein
VPAGFTPPPGPARPGAETERSEGSRAGAFGRAVIVPALVATVVGMAFVVVFLDAFHHPVPHHLPVAVVGDAQQAGQVRSALERATPGQFQVERIADQAGAQSAGSPAC